MNADLDSRGGFQCCSNGEGGCVNISVAGGQAADLCTADDNKSVLCVDCAKVANYLDGLISSCTQNGNAGVFRILLRLLVYRSKSDYQ